MTTRPARPSLVLGTVQLGLPYGVANRTGMPTEADAIDMIRMAIALGVNTLDTARAYGEAERRIGMALADRPDVEVITKLDPLVDIPSSDWRAAIKAAELSLATSRAHLDRDLQTVLLHRAEHRTAFGGAVWQTLMSEKARGRITRLGVSVQTPAELIGALDDPNVTHVQLPFNLLDHRWGAAGCVEVLRKSPEVTVHVRSAFLQGLLARPKEVPWPSLEPVERHAIMQWLDDRTQEVGVGSISALALHYVRAQDWIDGIVVGMETAAQLRSTAAMFAEPHLNLLTLARLTASLPRVPDELLDPAKWPRKAP